MHLTGILLVLQSGLAAAVPLIPALLSIRSTPTRDTSTPPPFGAISNSGNGCPQGQWSLLSASGDLDYTFSLPAFNTSIGPGTSISERSKNCQLHVDTNNAPGWQIAVKYVVSSGHLEIEGQGVSLTEFVTTYFSQDAAHTATLQQSIKSEKTAVSKTIVLYTDFRDKLIWSPCSTSGILNLNQRFAFTSTDKTSVGYFGNAENSTVHERVGFTWRRC